MHKHEYVMKKKEYYENSRKEMLEFIPADSQEILEIGCGGGDFAALLKSHRAVRVTAIEPYQAAAERARGRVDRLIEMPIEDALVVLEGQKFDCIILNDVLEHLTDPWDITRRLIPHLKQGGVVVASIPNMRYFPVFRELVMRAHWEYQDQGVMDRTHLRFFTKRTIQSMFVQSGFRVLRLEGINGLVFPWQYRLINRLASRAFEDVRYMQFACVALPLERLGGRDA